MNKPGTALAFTPHGMGIGTRAAVVGGMLLLEKIFLGLFVDFANAQTAEGLGAVVRVTQHWAFRFVVSFAVVAAVFGYIRKAPQLQRVDAEARAAPSLRPRWLLAHLALLVPLVPLSASLYGSAVSLPFAGVVALWLLLALLAAGALCAALAPWPLWLKAVRALGDVWWYAGIAAAGAASAMGWSQRLWTGMARVTFEGVYRLLDWLVPSLQVDPANLTIDTGRFAVVIAPVCSGLEGMGLMLAFCITLLLLFRREYIFPRALLLVPAGLMLSFALNIARIAALVLIGDAGYESVAVYGFHSQAGWLAFNAAAAGIALVSLRSPWLSRNAARPPAMAGENPTAVYLLPYLALILGGMLSRAASGGVESLYGLRVLLAGAALVYSWRRLRGVDWRFSWQGVVGGLAAFVLWIMAARLVPPPHALLPNAGSSWIVGHILVNVAVVPLVEELAFRGYLMRRLRTADFESLLPRRVGTVALIISAVVYGLCQGAFWLPGIMVGLVFGIVYMRTERLGEAVAAHVTGNVLISAAVLAGSQWPLV